MSRYSFLFISVLFVACTNQPKISPNIVVEGWIEQDRPPVVMLHESVSADKIGNWYTEDELKNLVIHWGKVTISDGKREYILTGKKDTMYMPPYIYTTESLKGEIGKKYTIKAEYSGITVTGETQMLEPPAFRQIERKMYEDSTFLIVCKFVENIQAGNGYAVFAKKHNEKQYTLCINGVFSSTNPNDTLSVEINQSMAGINKMKTHYQFGDTISLRFSRLDEQAFDFWTKYQTLSLSASFIFSPVFDNYPTNLFGGLGYFFAYASSYYNLILNSDTVIVY